MGNKLTAFFKNLDSVGSRVSLNYRGTPDYGTIIGGCLSLTVSIFLVLFLIITVYDWASSPQYYQQMELGYLSENPPPFYEIPTSNFLPTFFTRRLEKTGNVYNDEDLFYWKFFVGDLFVFPYAIEVPAVNCAGLIESFTDLEDDEKKSMIDALIEPKYQLCPNITSFKVQGQNVDNRRNLILQVFKKRGANQKNLQNTSIFSIEISRNFRPQAYSQQGFQDAFVDLGTMLFPVTNTTIQVEKTIFQEEIKFFDFKWLDSSTIPIANTTSLNNFKIRFVNERLKEQDFYNTVVTVTYIQDSLQHKFTWSVKSLDMVLAVVGGLSAIVWPTLNMILGGYETFKFRNSLISQIYPTSPQDLDNGDDDDIPPNEKKAKNAMMRTVAERGKYWYHYSEYLCTSFLSSCCCCLCKKSACYNRRLNRLKRHQQAAEKLVDEIDIVKLVYVQRIGQFIAKLTLNKYQRALVTSFKKYQIDDLGRSAQDGADTVTLLQPSTQLDSFTDDSDFNAMQDAQLLTKEQVALLTEIAERFKPDDSATDLSILYEVTGYQGESQNVQKWQWFQNYQDFDELGGSKLIRQDKDEFYTTKKRKLPAESTTLVDSQIN